MSVSPKAFYVQNKLMARIDRRGGDVPSSRDILEPFEAAELGSLEHRLPRAEKSSRMLSRPTMYSPPLEV